MHGISGASKNSYNDVNCLHDVDISHKDIFDEGCELLKLEIPPHSVNILVLQNKNFKRENQ